jgi:hypothetical protein
MATLKELADLYIKPAAMGSLLKYIDGNTSDIVKEIIETHKKGWKDTAAFAKYLQGKNTYETLENVWNFVKNNIAYKLDEFGSQFVKTPSRTWHDRYADCKSYSLFIASILQNLGITYRYRFVSYAKGGDYTHVYIVVPGTNLVIIDDVMPAFNKEKKFAHNYDIDMTKIYQMSGIGQATASTKSNKVKVSLIDLGNKDLSQISEGEMDLLIARDRLQTEKNIVSGIRGVGSPIAERYQNSIDMINDAIHAVNGYIAGTVEDIDVELGLIAGQANRGEYTIHKEICGIGSISDRSKYRLAHRGKLKQRRVAMTKKLTPTQKANIWGIDEISGSSIGKTKGFLKKVAKKVKTATKAVAKTTVKATKTVAKGTAKAAKTTAKVTKKVATAAVKVATAPARLAVKGILELTLPKASPFFLYLFITDEKVLAKCPSAVKKKRAKAEKIANFIVNAIGMKRSHFMGICRNGIMKHYGKSPENVIAEMTKGIKGIGADSDSSSKTANTVTSLASASTAVSALLEIIKKIGSLFKKKTESVSTSDAPSASDFASVNTSDAQSLSTEIKQQPENSTAITTESNDITTVSESDNLTSSASDNSTYSGGSSTADNSTSETTSSQASEEFSSGGKKVWSSL